MKRRNEPLVVPGLALDLEQFWHYSLSAKLKGEGGSNPDKNLDGFFLHESANDPNDGWSIVERIALRPHVDDDGQSDDKHIFLGSDAASVGYRQIRTRFELLQGEVANPANPPSGCYFHPRCPYAQDICRTETPMLNEVSPGHFASCHRVQEIELTGIGQADGGSKASGGGQ